MSKVGEDAAEKGGNITPALNSLKDIILSMSSNIKKTDDILTVDVACIKERLQQMQEYRANVDKMQEISNSGGEDYRKSIIGKMNFENNRIVQLTEEKGALKLLIRDYEKTLEIVMRKHRQIINKIADLPKEQCMLDDMECKMNEKCREVKGNLLFASVCTKVLDEIDSFEDSTKGKDSKIAQLEIENKIMRQMLNIKNAELDDSDETFGRHYESLLVSDKDDSTSFHWSDSKNDSIEKGIEDRLISSMEVRRNLEKAVLDSMPPPPTSNK
uniref:FGFR1 oncogene partner 2 homolog n=1 Tax=Rhabditophanes sp. KR3021 TaxID=114890 RepID=A0AC35UG76_9BILA